LAGDDAQIAAAKTIGRTTPGEAERVKTKLAGKISGSIAICKNEVGPSEWGRLADLEIHFPLHRRLLL
jgi:hypothetical protein